MNMKYKILVTRISYSSIEFDVDAENEVEARENALDAAANTVFSEGNADYETEIIAKG